MDNETDYNKGDALGKCLADDFDNVGAAVPKEIEELY